MTFMIPIVPPPTMRQLEYFVAVASEGSFSAAADECHVSQPGLSAQIRTLESTLGGELFERLPRNVKLTPRGERLLPRAQLLLRDMTDLVIDSADGNIVGPTARRDHSHHGALPAPDRRSRAPKGPSFGRPAFPRAAHC